MNVIFDGRRVRVLAQGTYREVWLAHPAARNALDVQMRDELYAVLGALAHDMEVTGVGMLGDGPDFCAGGDLQEFGSRPDVASAWQTRLVRSLPALFAELGPRLVVGIHGAAVGAGIELPAFARSIIAAPDARFRLPELGFGLVPGSGGTVSLPARIGRRRTFDLALSGEWLDASRARAWGLIDSLVDAPRLVQEVRSEAGR
jgi:enoyl-CoA hydratase/carnithine racemase